MNPAITTMTPERIGKYRIDGVLGSGAMGIVYRGYDVQVGRAVAIKTLRKELLGSDQAQETLDRFRNEARAAGRLSHPNIVTVYEFDEDNQTSYLAIEYVAGSGLDQWLARHGRADTNTALRWMSQLLGALDYAHTLGVVHRDVKPANLLLMDNGQIKLTDFGVARIDSSMLTQAGWLVGTPAYMAPEQLSGAAIDGRADVFSAGVVLHQLLTGRKLSSCAGSSVVRQSSEVELASELRAQREIPAAITEVLLRALAHDPAARYATAGDFLAALRAAHRTGDAQSASTVAQFDDDATQLIRPPRTEITPAPACKPGETDSALRSRDGWSSLTLQRIEASLAQHVGPIARVLVKRASTASGSMDELAAKLAAGIPDERARTRFLDTLSQHSSGLRNPTLHAPTDASSASHHSRSRSEAMPRAPATLPDASAIRNIEQRLTTYIGPMAKIALRHACAQPRSLRELCLALADSVPDIQARARFLREMGID